MKYLSLFVLCSVIAACGQSDNDKLDEKIRDMKARAAVDSILNSDLKASLIDTIGISKADIVITQANLVNIENSNQKNVKLYFKNKGTKKITGIRFRWYGINAFNEPADMGSTMQKGFGGGSYQDDLLAGVSNSCEWDVSSNDAKRILLAWPREIAYSDGTIWKSKSK